MGVFGGPAQTIFIVVAAAIAVIYSGKGVLIIRKVVELSYGKPGCAPVPDLGNVTLHYFAGRGRGEAIRLMLEETGIPYTETRFTKDTWPANKKKGMKSGLYTFGQVPAVETTSGVHLVQSGVIAHYIGRATGLECDCEDLHFCELVAAGTEDIRAKMGKVMYDPEFSVASWREYVTDTLPLWLGHLEKLAPAISRQDQSYFSSGRLTWVDFLVFDLVDANTELAKYDFGPSVVAVDILSQFPKLNSFYQHFASRPRISSYLRSNRRAAYTIPNQPKDLPTSAKS